MSVLLSETPRLVAPVTCEIGENPLWHPETRTVYFLDIAGGTVWAYTPDSGQTRRVSQGPPTGAMLVHEDGSFLLFQDGRIARLGPDGVQRELVRGLCPGNERFNDAIADPRGRVFAGVFGPRGHLLRIDLDGCATPVVEGVGVPNGLGFSPDGRYLYFTDSVPRRLYVFEYDVDTGTLGERRVLAEIPKPEGVPDGMAIDAAGCLWTAVWFGARLKRFAPDGRLDREVAFPMMQTSAVAFGGDDLGDIYVTTAAGSGADAMLPPGRDPHHPRGDGLYGLRIEGIRGRPTYRVRVHF